MSQLISLQDAIDLTSNFRSNKETILDSTYRNMGTLPICETFEWQDIKDLMDQTDCSGIRVYLGMDSNDKVKIVVVGINSSAEDILTRDAELIAEEGDRCPPGTVASSPLNS